MPADRYLTEHDARELEVRRAARAFHDAALDAINRAEPEHRKRLLNALRKPQPFRIVEGAGK